MTVWATRADQVDLRGPNPHDLARSPKKPKKSALDRELDRADKETKRRRADDNKRRVAAAGSATAGPATAVIPDSDLEDLLPDVQCTHCPVHCPDPVSYTHLRAHETVLDLVC